MGVFGIGVQALMDLAREGRLRPKHLGAALKGFGAFTELLIDERNRRGAKEAQACCNVCLTCEARFTQTLKQANELRKYGLVQVSWCGRPLEPDDSPTGGPDGGGPVCGCPVGIRCLSEHSTEAITDAAGNGGVWFDPKDPIESRYPSGGLMAHGKCLVKGHDCPRKKWPKDRDDGPVGPDPGAELHAQADGGISRG